MTELDDSEDLALRKTLKLERYAEIFAHVLHFGTERTEVVVRRFGFTLDAWRAVDRAWSRELSMGIKRRQAAQGLRFSGAFHGCRQRLEKTQPGIDSIGEPEVRTRTSRPPPSRAAAASGPSAPRSHRAPPAAVPSYMRNSDSGGSPPARPSVPESNPAVATAPSPRASSGGSPRTVELPAFQTPPSPPVPFKAGPAVLPPTSAPLPRTPTGTEQLPLSEVVPSPLPLQPPAGGAPSTATLTLAQFAALTVETGRNPPDLGVVLQRYGLGGIADLGRVSAAFQTKMRADPALRAMFDALVAQLGGSGSGRR